jgi:hypothetical protein
MKLKLFREWLCSYNLLKYKSGGSHSSKFIGKKNGNKKNGNEKKIWKKGG